MPPVEKNRTLVRSVSPPVITVNDLRDALGKIDRAYDGDGCLHLIGETSHVAEGWREWTTRIEFFGDVVPIRKAFLHTAIEKVVEETGYPIISEFPGDLIPLPKGYMERTRDVSDASFIDGLRLKVRHFDPYSVVFRFIARGDEPDYHIALMYLDKGWISFDEMDRRLEALLPEFSLETIAQDPAEFRRKYRGLAQMWSKRLRPRTVHRLTET